MNGCNCGHNKEEHEMTDVDGMISFGDCQVNDCICEHFEDEDMLSERGDSQAEWS